MNRFKYLALVAVAAAGVCFTATAPKAEAQISIGVDIGAAPECPMATMTLLLIAALPTATTAGMVFGPCVYWRRPVVSWPRHLPRPRE